MDITSKRVRGNNPRNGTAAATTKKKAEEVVMTKAVEEERNEGGEGLVVVEEAAALEVEELWLRSWSGVDEGMPWATCWFPVSEVEAALGGDDVWDYDIWGLKGGDNIAPNV